MRAGLRWIGVAMVPLIVGGMIWWGLRPSPEASAPAPAPLPSRHERCQPVPDVPPQPSFDGPVDAGDWEVSLAGARLARSLPGSHGSDPFEAEAGRRFVVVDLELRRRGRGGGEAGVRSSGVVVTCQDGMAITPWGWMIGSGFCALCGFDLGVEDAATRLTFALKVDEEWVGQPFEVRYLGAGPLRFQVPPA
jgi:hypothetical protein